VVLFASGVTGLVMQAAAAVEAAAAMQQKGKQELLQELQGIQHAAVIACCPQIQRNAAMLLLLEH
jgi:hypothetical protein